MTVGTLSDWLDVAVTGVLGLARLYFAHSVSRRTDAEVRTKVADKRFQAYGRLWETMAAASPMRNVTGKGPLSPDERTQLFEALGGWYYRGGNGMLLSEVARNIHITAAVNLVCDVDGLRPKSLAVAVRQSAKPDSVRGAAAIRQLSLLRTALRSDLALYASPWGQELTPADKEFLAACGVDMTAEPWRRSSRGAVASPFEGDPAKV